MVDSGELKYPNELKAYTTYISLSECHLKKMEEDIVGGKLVSLEKIKAARSVVVAFDKELEQLIDKYPLPSKGYSERLLSFYSTLQIDFAYYKDIVSIFSDTLLNIFDRSIAKLKSNAIKGQGKLLTIQEFADIFTAAFKLFTAKVSVAKNKYEKAKAALSSNPNVQALSNDSIHYHKGSVLDQLNKLRDRYSAFPEKVAKVLQLKQTKGIVKMQAVVRAHQQRQKKYPKPANRKIIRGSDPNSGA